MSALVLRHNWTRQPQVQAEIDWGNPLSDGLLWFVTGNSGQFFDFVRHRDYGVGPSKIVTPYGRGHYYAGSRWQPVGFPAFPVERDFTLFVLANPGNTRASCFCQRTAAGTNHIELRFGSDAAGEYSSNSVGWRAGSGGTFVVAPVTLDGGWRWFTGRLRGVSQGLFVAGLLASSGDRSSGIFAQGTPTFAGLSDSTGIPYTGGIAVSFAFQSAKSDREIYNLTRNPWQLLRPMQRRLWVGVEAAANIDALTADNLTVSSPVLGAPAIGQAHALTATALAVSSPVLGYPALGQAHALTASGITVEGPVLGAPALAQIHALVAQNFATSSPVLGVPAAGQIHTLTANSLAVSSPVLGTPTLAENAADVDALTADNLVVGSPVLGTPAIGQIHVLGSDGLVTGSPALGSPSVTQIHTLEALGLTVGVPVLGTPALNGGDIVLIDASEVGRAATLQARNYRATLAKRNYTARL